MTKLILFMLIPSIVCVVGSIVLVMNNRPEWICFLPLAILFYPSIRRGVKND